MAEPTKDTIYVDVDDEITGIIDKLRSSNAKVLALVLPKRATVLQSVVNMKLLKRTADEAKKNLVLITTEAGLLPLAGAVGLHVAKTLTSRPEIPEAPDMDNSSEETVDETMSLPNDSEEAAPTLATAGSKPVGELAGATTAAKKALDDDSVETVELDDEPEEPIAPMAEKPKAKKDKKLSVPSFDRFRLWLILGGLLVVVLIVAGYFAFIVLPKATITIQTDASNVNTNINLSLDTTADSLNPQTKTVPAKQVTEQKTYTGMTTTTGQKNNGDKATGNVTMTAGSCSANVPADIASGTALSSTNLTFITTESVSFVPIISHSHCTYQGEDQTGSTNISISAQSGGAASNVSNADFTVYERSDVSATGSTTGGTDNIQQIVSAADITTAESKINTQASTVQQYLENQLQNQNLYPIAVTYSTGTPTSTNSANVGDVATNVTVTEVISYSMLGASQSDLKTLVDNDIKSQIDSGQQGILSEGITQSAFKLVNTTTNGAALTLQTTAEVGPNISTDSIKQAAAGKKSGDVQATIKDNPDVTNVNIKLSPFWVSSVPKKLSKITVTIAQPTTTAHSNND